jgi:hypothetical protein
VRSGFLDVDVQVGFAEFTVSDWIGGFSNEISTWEFMVEDFKAKCVVFVGEEG